MSGYTSTVVGAKAARRYQHRKYRLLSPHSVRLFPCPVPVCPLRRDYPSNEHPLTITKAHHVSVGELLKFFGVVVLMTRFEFGKRHDFERLVRLASTSRSPRLARHVCLATDSTRNYTACAQKDRRNRCRQADLDLEKKVGTMIGHFA
jgi:hypothetical protein